MARQTRWPYILCAREAAQAEARALRLLLRAHGRLPVVSPLVVPSVEEWLLWRRAHHDGRRAS